MHHTVLVIGDNPVDALEPYYECEDSPSILGNNILYSLNYFDPKTKLDSDCILIDDEYADHGYFETNEEAFDFVNRNGITNYHIECVPRVSFYDWYSIGGRWAGFFQLKNNFDEDKATQSTIIHWINSNEEILKDRTDSSLLSEIDFRHMLIKEAWTNRKAYRLGKKLFSLVPVTQDGYEPNSYRKIFETVSRESPSLKPILNYINAEQLLLCNSEQEYIKNNAAKCISPHALLYEDEYITRDEWEITEEVTWNNHIKELLLSLPEDTRVTLVDCHS